MNVYRKFKQIGRGRRAWICELVWSGSTPAIDGLTVFISGGRLPSLGISEVVSYNEHSIRDFSIFDLTLATGGRLMSGAAAKRAKSVWRVGCCNRSLKIVYSAKEAMDWFRRRNERFYSPGEMADALAALDMQFACAGMYRNPAAKGRMEA